MRSFISSTILSLAALGIKLNEEDETTMRSLVDYWMDKVKHHNALTFDRWEITAEHERLDWDDHMERCWDLMENFVHPEYYANKLGDEHPGKVQDLADEILASYPEQGDFWLNDGVSYFKDKCDAEVHLIQGYQAFDVYDQISDEWGEHLATKRVEDDDCLILKTQEIRAVMDDEEARLDADLWALAHDEEIKPYIVFHRMAELKASRIAEIDELEQKKEQEAKWCFPDLHWSYYGDSAKLPVNELTLHHCSRIANSQGIRTSQLKRDMKSWL